MTDIQFYHLTSTPLERALPKLLEKSLQAGFKARVKLESEEKAEWMNGVLWTYHPDAFLPHGTRKDGYSEEQPIYLTEGDENPANADLLVVTDGTLAKAEPALKRVLDIFDGRDDAQVASARERWKQYQAQGLTVTYIRQNDAGGWEKAA
jgi:DNA polymerase-3 subunit chi